MPYKYGPSPRGQTGRSALPNVGHERYCQARARGDSQRVAYTIAGYSAASPANATRLERDPSIKRRISFLKEQFKVRGEIEQFRAITKVDRKLKLTNADILAYLKNALMDTLTRARINGESAVVLRTARTLGQICGFIVEGPQVVRNARSLQKKKQEQDAGRELSPAGSPDSGSPNDTIPTDDATPAPPSTEDLAKLTALLSAAAEDDSDPAEDDLDADAAS